MVNKMLIVIGTLNRAKTEGFKKAVDTISKNINDPLWNTIEYNSVETSSGVSSRPLSTDEMINGAINRARDALKKVPNADFSVGMEGGVYTNSFGTYLGAWIAIIKNSQNTTNHKEEIGLGCSAFIEIPKDFAERLNNGEEMGPLMQELMNDKNNNIRHSNGTSGVLTSDLYTRNMEFEHATICAFAKFLNPQMYKGDYFRKKDSK